MIVLCGEAMGENEAKIGRGFVGPSGIELLRMLNEAGLLELTSVDQDYISKFYTTGDPHLLDMVWLLHPEFYRTNVFQRHPTGNKIETFLGGKAEGIRGFPALVKGKYVRQEFIHELERLGDELVTCNPNLIICLGNSALWALTGQVGISKVRGTTSISTHTAAGFKLLPTYHPAAVLRQWELRPVTIVDLMKAKREAEYPEIRRPKREIWIEPTLEDLHAFASRYIAGCRHLAVDIETAGNQVTCIGFAPSGSVALVIPFLDERRKGRSYWPTAAMESAVWLFVRQILEDGRISKIFQNGLYDVAFLWRANGIAVRGADEDTMLAHHALHPESLKSLGFLGSIYCEEGSWKVERKSNTIKRDD